MALEGDQRWSSSVVLKHCCPFYLLFWMLLHFLFMACSASPLFSKFVCNFPYLHGESNPGVTFHSPVARAEWCSPKYRTSGTRGLAPARIPLLPRLSLASLLCRALQWRPGGRRWRGAGGVIRNSSQSVSQSVTVKDFEQLVCLCCSIFCSIFRHTGKRKSPCPRSCRDLPRLSTCQTAEFVGASSLILTNWLYSSKRGRW